MADIVQVIVFTATIGSVLGLVALGYSLVYSTTKIVNFCHVAMMFVAGYLIFAGFDRTKGNWPIAVAVIVATVGSAIIGLVVELVAVRPLRLRDASSSLGWILATYAVAAIATDVVRDVVTKDPVVLPNPIESIGGWHRSVIEGVAVRASDVVLLAIALALMIGLEWFLRRTTIGRSFRAVAEDRTTAGLMGINTTAVVMASFAIAGALAAVAAAFSRTYVSLEPQVAIVFGLQAFVAAVIGGLTSTKGAVVGGYVVGLVQGITLVINPDRGALWVDVIVFSVFLVVLMLRPFGLFGDRQPEKV